MYRVFAFALALVVAAPAAAGASPMAVMQYYVGTWTCVGGTIGEPTTNASLTYRMDAGVLSEHIVVAPSGTMTTSFGMDVSTAWDAKTGRYVTAGIRADAHWWASAALPWTGNTESWNDVASDTGRLDREVVVRTDERSYRYTVYRSGNAVFTSTCHRT